MSIKRKIYSNKMIKKVGLAVFALGVTLATTFLILNFMVFGKFKLENLNPFGSAGPISKAIEKIELAKEGDNSKLKAKEIVNILLIGIDRRNKSQTGFNTDVMILVSIDTQTKRVLLTSVPRDVWINGNKINALYTVFGEETLVDAFEKITGQDVDGYIRCDFEDFRWIIDAMGGVPIDVERSFTDNTFPNNSDTAVVSVTFTQGKETMPGDRALIFARSRKGNNGEGSDLMRAKRQHLILKGMIEGISQSKSQFWPMDVDSFFGTVTATGKMLTTLELEDIYYLWRFYDERDQYNIESFVIGDDYIYHPGLYPASDYHAWVFIPRDPTWTVLHTDIRNKLDGTFVEEMAPAN